MLRVDEMRWAAQRMDDRALSLRANSKEVCSSCTIAVSAEVEWRHIHVRMGGVWDFLIWWTLR
jgi:hypothetical protein